MKCPVRIRRHWVLRFVLNAREDHLRPRHCSLAGILHNTNDISEG